MPPDPPQNINVNYTKPRLRRSKPDNSSDALSSNHVASSNVVLARLQAFLPINYSPSVPNVQQPSQAQQEVSRDPGYVKIKITTWNMHESLPKGNLDALLGTIPLYDPTVDSAPSLEIPGLQLDAAHPYHIVVVAGQECPTTLGLPLGLGGGFKWEKEKEVMEKDQEAKDKNKPQHKDYEKPVFLRASQKQDQPPRSSQESFTPSITSQGKIQATSGWSDILDDYFSRGLGSVAGAQPAIPQTNNPSTTSLSPEHLNPPPHSKTTAFNKAAPWKLPYGHKDVPRVGPYELLAKERMMGIYLAVYIHRQSRKLVKGVSKSSVTTGLIGGRLGNKGGVGISLNFNGTTFLFINAHLAAHEGRVATRLANMTKIKAELDLDTFLPANDPRMSEDVDLTDRFDHTFICGDLNFRLEVSRLHAEWLISRREFAQAQEFDQLRQIMKRNEAFIGFHEHSIGFPPTFKYDVLRTLKRSKGSKRVRLKRQHKAMLSEVEEREEMPVTVDNVKDSEGDDDEQEQEGEEAGSMLSSPWTSVYSRPSSAGEISSREDVSTKDLKTESYDAPRAKFPLLLAARKAKDKWLVAFRSVPVLPHQETPDTELKQEELVFPAEKGDCEGKAQDLRVAGQSSVSIPAIHDNQVLADTSSLDGMNAFAPILMRSVSGKSSNYRAGAAIDIESKGLYDTSNKKRVPSWCDRILFKSTVDPPVYEEDIFSQSESLPKPSFWTGNLLIGAFKPRNREQRNSIITSPSLTISDSSSNSPDVKIPNEPSVPFSRFVQPTHEAALTFSPTTEIRPLKASPHIGSITDHLNRRVTSPNTRPGAQNPSLGRPRAMSAGVTGSKPSDLNVISPSKSQPDPAAPAPVSTTATGVRRWFSFQFLSHNKDISRPINIPPPPATPKAKKGDMVCLEYTTLSDQEMRRLEGRSDHRPVLGSYAVYI